MPATLIGDVGIWGIASSEVPNGIIIEKIADTSKNKKKEIANKAGERVGRADYDQSMDISISGKFTSSAGFSQKLSGDLVMANTITTGHLAGTITGGRTLINEIKRERSNEDWFSIDVEAEFLTYFPAA